MSQQKKRMKIDENSFTNPVWYCIMVNKHETKALYPNMMSLLELCVIIPSSTAECGFSGVKLLCTCLRASMLPSILDILMRICRCGDSLLLEKVVDIYQDSVVYKNDSGSQTKRCEISLWKILTKELISCYSHTLDLSFSILFYKDSRSFVNLLMRLICQTT